MPRQKQPLHLRLEKMSEDLAIAGEVNFRAMGIAAVLSHRLKPEDAAEMERLLRRSDRLVDDLLAFWKSRPTLKRLGDPAGVAGGAHA